MEILEPIASQILVLVFFSILWAAAIPCILLTLLLAGELLVALCFVVGAFLLHNGFTIIIGKPGRWFLSERTRNLAYGTGLVVSFAGGVLIILCGFWVDMPIQSLPIVYLAVAVAFWKSASYSMLRASNSENLIRADGDLEKASVTENMETPIAEDVDPDSIDLRGYEGEDLIERLDEIFSEALQEELDNPNLEDQTIISFHQTPSLDEDEGAESLEEEIEPNCSESNENLKSSRNEGRQVDSIDDDIWKQF